MTGTLTCEYLCRPATADESHFGAPSGQLRYIRLIEVNQKRRCIPVISCGMRVSQVGNKERTIGHMRSGIVIVQVTCNLYNRYYAKSG